MFLGRGVGAGVGAGVGVGQFPPTSHVRVPPTLNVGVPDALDLEVPSKFVLPLVEIFPLSVFDPVPCNSRLASDALLPMAASVIAPDPALRVRFWAPLIAAWAVIPLLFELSETSPPERVTAPVKVRPS